MTVLITGGTGFIGSFLARELLNTTSKKIILFDYYINEKRISDIIENDKVEVVQGDISNWSEILGLFKNNETIETIYHFGSLMPPLTESKLETAFKINIQGTFNLLECARLFEVSQVIYSSSGAVYGPGIDLPITEKSYRDPWTMYGVGKVCSEILGGYYQRRQNVEFTTFRFPALIGPGRTGRGMTIFANNIIQYPAQGQPAVCNVEPDVSIPILYIKDAARLLSSIVDTGTPSPAYNLDGYWLEARELEKLVKQEIPDAEVKYEPDDILTFQLKSWSMMKGDDSLVREELDFEPEYSPEQFVNDFIKEVKQNKHFQIS